MARLYTHKVGDVLVEFYGPVTGRNYNVSGSATPVAPVLEVEVIGNGGVQVYQSTTPVFSAPNQINAVMFETDADPASWTALGTPITSASGKVSLTPPIGTTFSALRVVLTTLGDGKLIVNPIWN